MNAAAKALSQGGVFRGEYKTLNVTRSILSSGAMIVLILLSALAVVYFKNVERQLFSELQMVKKEQSQTQVAYGKLLIEQSTYAAPSRMHEVASTRLGMILPVSKKVIVIKR